MSDSFNNVRFLLDNPNNVPFNTIGRSETNSFANIRTVYEPRAVRVLYTSVFSYATENRRTVVVSLATTIATRFRTILTRRRTSIAVIVVRAGPRDLWEICGLRRVRLAFTGRSGFRLSYDTKLRRNIGLAERITDNGLWYRYAT